jgi:hypothetical protein
VGRNPYRGIRLFANPGFGDRRCDDAQGIWRAGGDEAGAQSGSDSQLVENPHRFFALGKLD